MIDDTVYVAEPKDVPKYELGKNGEWALKRGKDYEWERIVITDIPVEILLVKWEQLVNELSDKESELANLKEEYNQKEFEIVFQSDIDFKALYGSASEKTRKQHATKTLSELNQKKTNLELRIQWIKQYIPLIREVVRMKQ